MGRPAYTFFSLVVNVARLVGGTRHAAWCRPVPLPGDAVRGDCGQLKSKGKSDEKITDDVPGLGICGRLDGVVGDAGRSGSAVDGPGAFRYGRGVTSGADDLADFSAAERVNIAVYENANRGVVNITTRMARQQSFFFDEGGPSEGSGSGSVLDKQGHVLTNLHVVEDAKSARVTLFNNETFTARPVGADPDNDIAVLKIDAPPEMLFPIKLGDSTRLRVGQKIFAIGNPFGLERTMTVGIISSLNRQIPSRNRREMKSIIQIDAALNSGNSGGPLLDSRSQLIGMNTAIVSPSGAGENTGVGFAIPVTTIRRVVPQLIRHGRVIRPDTGISRVYQTEEGLVIATLVPGGPAERAGLKGFRRVRQRRRVGGFVFDEMSWDYSSADRIVAVNGEMVKTADELLTIIERKRPGEEVTMTVVRSGRRINVQITLGDSD